MEKANEYILLLSGVITENQYYELIEGKTDSQVIQAFIEKMNAKHKVLYEPILDVLKNNKEILKVFSRFVTDLKNKTVTTGNYTKNEDYRSLNNFFTKHPKLMSLFKDFMGDILYS